MKTKSHVRLTGLFRCEVKDARGRIVKRFSFHNGPTSVGLTDILKRYFNNVAQLYPWYLGIIDGTTPPTLGFADTMALHPGWIENTGYSNATRPQWIVSAPNGGVITGTAQFNINNNILLGGSFLVSDNTVGGTAGILVTTGLSPLTNLGVGNLLTVFYTITLTPNS